MKKLVFLVAVGLLMVLFAGVFFQRHAIACEVVGLVGWQGGESNVFFHPGFDPDQQLEILSDFAEAQQRISRVFGPPVSNPRVLIALDADSAAWGADATASMHRAPRMCVVIGPHGRNVDVIAHELMHAEMQHRLGLIRTLRQLPSWFDEGVALMVDHREPFLPENIELEKEAIEAVTRLWSGRAFASQSDLRAGYQAARLAAGQRLGDHELYAGLKRIRQGEAFDQVFPMSGTEEMP